MNEFQDYNEKSAEIGLTVVVRAFLKEEREVSSEGFEPTRAKHVLIGL